MPLATIESLPGNIDIGPWTGTSGPKVCRPVFGWLSTITTATNRINPALSFAGETVLVTDRDRVVAELRQRGGERARHQIAHRGLERHALRRVGKVLDLLDEWGVPVAPHRKRCRDLDEVIDWARRVEHEYRASLNFAIDGGVVKLNEISLQDDVGVIGGREPRWAIARKFAPDIAETTLLDIGVNVGRTGALNPYAVLEPVAIGGAVVTFATLHNEDLILRKDLRIGDRVQVKRAGEVIPQVIGPVPEHRRPGARLHERHPLVGRQHRPGEQHEPRERPGSCSAPSRGTERSIPADRHDATATADSAGNAMLVPEGVSIAQSSSNSTRSIVPANGNGARSSQVRAPATNVAGRIRARCSARWASCWSPLTARTTSSGCALPSTACRPICSSRRPAAASPRAARRASRHASPSCRSSAASMMPSAYGVPGRTSRGATRT